MTNPSSTTNDRTMNEQQHPSDARDAGMTLTELLITIGMLGLITTVLVAAVTVVFRSEAGINNTVGESHDIQQAVNYFHQDVQSGPVLLADYDAGGSGCSDAGGDNVFRFETPELRIAYRLMTNGPTAELDRYECTPDGSGGWTQASIVNIADRLDATNGSPVTVTVVPDANVGTEVGTVQMAFAQSISNRAVAASPRAEAGLAVAPPPGVCANDPLEATDNFQTFVEGDMHVTGSQVKHSLAVGGALSFEGNVSVGQNMNVASEFPAVPSLANAALLVGSVDWPATAGFGNGTLTVHSGADVAVANFSGSAVSSQGQNKTVYQQGDGNQNPSIKVQNGGAVLQNLDPIVFDDAFAELRACAALMAAMPSSCSCSGHVTLTNVNGNPYEGTAQNDSVKLALVAGQVNVLNIPEANLDQLHDIKWVSQFPSATSPLIINVASGSNVSFTPPQIQGAGGTAEFIMWNFPNADGTVTISGGGGDGVWGTVFAPYADVTASVKIEGGVVAKSFTFTGSSINPSRSFEGEIPWD